MGTVTSRPMSAEEFFRLPGDAKRRSLVRGEVVETMPPGGLHGTVASEIAFRLHTWAKGGPKGHVGVESGFLLARNPDTVRGPDVYYVGPERAPNTGVPEAFWDIAPDLAVEVVSPGDGADEVRQKVRDYLAAGTRLVWLVYPRTREVVVHTPDGLSRAYGEGDTLEAFDALPGFACAVTQLFD